MNTEKHIRKFVGSIDMTPSWQSATRIYIEVLKNPKAGRDAHHAAETDLMNLATFADKMIAERKANPTT